MNRSRLYIFLLFTVFLSALSAWLIIITGVQAAPTLQETTPTPQDTSNEGDLTTPNKSISDEVCLECHGQPGLTLELENGELLDLYVPADAHANSVHGEMGYACVQCHTTVGNYPHPPFSAKDSRDATLQLYDVCQRCHAHTYELAQDSVHAEALNNGQREAAVCTDCHTAHDVRRLNDPETKELLPDAHTWIPQTCARCHSTIYEKYKESVHGSVLIGEGNQDVPTCIDCHGVHNIEDPTVSSFRLKSPQICAECHTDAMIMDKYGISTEVLNTYVADFHGTSVVLFEPETPDSELNKPVCFDCHGVHDISRADDPNKGLQVKENLLHRCQACHPDATGSFPDSWLSHYIPSRDKNPIVYFVNLFYYIFIPGVLGGMLVLVTLDASRSVLNKYRISKEKKEVEQISLAKQEIGPQSVEVKSGESEKEVDNG
jgi:hypothetical protein